MQDCYPGWGPFDRDTNDTSVSLYTYLVNSAFGSQLLDFRGRAAPREVQNSAGSTVGAPEKRPGNCSFPSFLEPRWETTAF